ncbi:patellin-3 [Capsicum annuum]|uniref:patellin-3 n=1 Tax=Capsicum annuum TaxID=4072 RepID=UPI001FB18AB9|nr:patellin-3 [Capsicum annuum]
MAEEIKKTASETKPETTVVVVSDVPDSEKESTSQTEPASVVVSDVPEAEKELTPQTEQASETDKGKSTPVIESASSFKEESNKVEELPNPEQKALAELKELVRDALNKHEFTAPVVEEKKETALVVEEKKEAEPVVEEKKETVPVVESKKEAEPVVEEKKETVPVVESKKEAEPVEKKEAVPVVEVKKEAEPVVEEKKEAEPVVEEKKEAEPVVEEKKEAAPVVEEKKEGEPAAPAEKVTEKVAAKEEDSAKTVEEIKETIVEVTGTASSAQVVEEKQTEEDVQPPAPAPEEVSIWGIPLLADERSDVILLKFLRARDFKVKDAFAMLKSVVSWRKEFNIDQLLEEDLSGLGLEKVVYNHGVDKEGHPVCYNAFGAFQDNELYQNTFADKEKMNKFLRWRIQFMEKSIRNLDFSPDGICTFVQVIDLKNSPGLFLFKKELRQATNRALQLLQDNYPEFVAKQVFINVPWWYPAYYRMINVLFTTRTKSKFVFAGASRSAETLFRYIVPEQVPVQYGGLSREGEHEFTIADPATEDTIKPASKHTIEFPVTEKTNLAWEARVIGWDVSYGAEFVPSAEGGYTIIVEKSRKVTAASETVITNNYIATEPGKVVLTFDNQTSKRKKLVYRTKTKPSD